eukprot:gene32317-16888_t
MTPEAGAGGRSAEVKHKLEDYQCAVCLSLIYDPVVAPCGHDACHSCMLKWRSYQNKRLGVFSMMRTEFTCPVCRDPLPPGELRVCCRYRDLLGEIFPEEIEERRIEDIERKKEEQAENAAAAAQATERASRFQTFTDWPWGATLRPGPPLEPSGAAGGGGMDVPGGRAGQSPAMPRLYSMYVQHATESLQDHTRNHPRDAAGAAGQLPEMYSSWMATEPNPGNIHQDLSALRRNPDLNGLLSMLDAAGNGRTMQAPDRTRAGAGEPAHAARGGADTDGAGGRRSDAPNMADLHNMADMYASTAHDVYASWDDVHGLFSHHWNALGGEVFDWPVHSPLLLDPAGPARAADNISRCRSRAHPSPSFPRPPLGPSGPTGPRRGARQQQAEQERFDGSVRQQRQEQGSSSVRQVGSRAYWRADNRAQLGLQAPGNPGPGRERADGESSVGPTAALSSAGGGPQVAAWAVTADDFTRGAMDLSREAMDLSREHLSRELGSQGYPQDYWLGPPGVASSLPRFSPGVGGGRPSSRPGAGAGGEDGRLGGRELNDDVHWGRLESRSPRREGLRRRVMFRDEPTTLPTLPATVATPAAASPSWQALEVVDLTMSDEPPGPGELDIDIDTRLEVPSFLRPQQRGPPLPRFVEDMVFAGTDHTRHLASPMPPGPSGLHEAHGVLRAGPPLFSHDDLVAVGGGHETVHTRHLVSPMPLNPSVLHEAHDVLRTGPPRFSEDDLQALLTSHVCPMDGPHAPPPATTTTSGGAESAGGAPPLLSDTGMGAVRRTLSSVSASGPGRARFRRSVMQSEDDAHGRGGDSRYSGIEELSGTLRRRARVEFEASE